MKRTISHLFLIGAFILKAQAGWFGESIGQPQPKDFSSVEGRFFIKTTATLKENITTNETVLSEGMGVVKLVVHMFGGEQSGLAYSVCYNDFPEWVFKLADTNTMSDALLDSAGLGLKTLNNGNLLMNTKISLASFPGREVLVESQSKRQAYSIKARYYLAGTRLYQIMVVAPKGKGGVSETTAFLESFRLLTK